MEQNFCASTVHCTQLLFVFHTRALVLLHPRKFPLYGTYIPAIQLNQCSTSQVNNFRGGQGAVGFVFWSVVRIHFMHIAVLYYPRRVEGHGYNSPLVCLSVCD